MLRTIGFAARSSLTMWTYRESRGVSEPPSLPLPNGWPHNPDGHYALDGRNSHTASSAFTWATTNGQCDPQRLLLVFRIINTTVSANFWTISIATTGGNSD